MQLRGAGDRVLIESSREKWAFSRRDRVGVSPSVRLPRTASEPEETVTRNRTRSRHPLQVLRACDLLPALSIGPAPSAERPPESPPLPPAVLSGAPTLPLAPPIPAHVRASVTQLRSAGVFLPGPRCGSQRAPALSVMAVPKRKAPGGQDSTASPAGAAKRARTEELTGVRFKAQLRDPQGAGQGECGAGLGRGPRAASRPGFGRGFRVPDTAPPFGHQG